MRYARPYIAASAVKPGCGVVQGSAEGRVKSPASDGSGDFIGVYAFEANEPKEAGDQIGIAITGVVKVLAGGSAAAGKKAVLKSDDSGTFATLPTAAGRYSACGTFLESGAAGEYVDMLIERGSVTIS
jgi:hypothetical protein